MFSDYRVKFSIPLLSLIYMYSLLYSLEGNGIGNSGATALADALRVNQSLKTLRYIP